MASMAFSWTFCLGLILCVLCTDARSPRNRRDATDKCPTPSPPANGNVECLADSLGLDVYCSFTCKTGYRFKGVTDEEILFVCDVNTGFNDNPVTPPCVATCEFPCLNNGTCVAPDTCQCVGNWHGSHCEHNQILCANPQAGQFGTIDCVANTDGGKVCIPHCFPNYVFETTPPKQYVCSKDGIWTPDVANIPNCMEDLTHTSAATTHSTTVGRISREAVCAIWGTNHFRTFDNKVYNFEGFCRYSLVYAPHIFEITLVNDPSCASGSTCKRQVEIFQGNDKISLHTSLDGPELTWNNQVLTVPGFKENTVFEKLGNYLTLRSTLGYSIKWDGKQSVFVQISEDLKGKLLGLCGKYNGNPADDFTDQQGHLLTAPGDFGVTWKRTMSGDNACTDTQQTTGCGSQPQARQQSAQNTCAVIQSDPAFRACNEVVNPGPYVDSCQTDCCGTSAGSCMCDAMEAYSRACMEKGVKLNWRKQGRCEISCSNGKVFKECGSSCVKDCRTVSTVCSDPTCVDGCFCPDGTVLHNGNCITPNKCPCERDGHQFAQGDVIPEHCNNCTCNGGSWTCTHLTCDKTCSATGDPHYETFDGTRYNFMGTCSYYLIKDRNFSIITDNIQCGHGEASCTKSITILMDSLTIKLDHNHQLFINGQEIKALPYQAAGIKVSMVSSLFLQAVLSNGITVLWDGNTRAYIKVPPTFFGKTIGLCGTFDGNSGNDFMTELGNIETHPNAFGNHWKTDASCSDLNVTSVQDLCDINPQKKAQATALCDNLKSDIFKACHHVEDVLPYYEDCIYDLCACTGNMKDCMCPNIGSYADTCAAKGVKISWRPQITECMVHCPAGQEYKVCARPCEHTCRDITLNTDDLCDAKCVEGCNCPDGQTLGDNGHCVPISSCPCIFDGRMYPAGFSTLKESEICICDGGKFVCSKITVPLKDMKPLCPNNTVYTKCTSNCPLTCENVHNPPTCSNADCKAGCECLPGLVLDGDHCVSASTCPCYHAGKAFSDGETYIQDCNECTCIAHKWQCTLNECPSVCSAYGDSHYTTFDGNHYEFQGTCDYVLAQSTQSNSNRFVLTTHNSQCGTSGVTCFKEMDFVVGNEGTDNFYKLQLIRGQSVVPDPGSPFTAREVGDMVYISTPFGVSLQWDKQTRVYVQLTKDHINKVEGLCGNFNHDSSDDFRNSSGRSVVKPTEFGDSWRQQSTCAPSLDITDTCQSNPQRKVWAQHSCSVLDSELFKPCHNFVDRAQYIKRCQYDACGCDLGGDCECLCTAIAAYAHECAVSGIPIQWRSNDLCPIQCEQCEIYNPCISLCPKKTCENRLVYSEITKDCENTKGLCFEGCDLKPCPQGQVYDSLEDPVTCIPESLCSTTACEINGKKYREGEQVEDVTVCRPECEICICRSGILEHITLGQCEQITIYKTSTPSENTGSPTPSYYENRTPPSDGGGKVCDELLGLFSKDIAVNDQFSASSSQSIDFEAYQARLFNTHSGPVNGGAWVPRQSDQSPYISVDLEKLEVISGIAVQGQPDVSHWVTKFMVSTSVDGTSFFPYSDTLDTNPKIFAGNYDRNTVVKSFFDRAINARVIQIYPVEWHEAIALRMDVITCRGHATPPFTNTASSSPLTLGVSGSSVTNGLHGSSTFSATTELHSPTSGAGQTTTSTHVPLTPFTHIPAHGCLFWSPWVSRTVPDQVSGEMENFYQEPPVANACSKDFIVGIECRVRQTKVMFDPTDPYVECSLNDATFTCIPDTDHICEDYEIRVQCNTCSLTTVPRSTPTASVSSPTENNFVSTSTSSVGSHVSSPQPCVSGWSPWINKATPTGTHGDYEKMTKEEMSEFCPGGHMTEVHCRDASTGDDYWSLKEATCTVEDGLICDSMVTIGIECHDYEIRYMCQCSEIPYSTTVGGHQWTSAPGHTEQTSTPASVPPFTVPTRCDIPMGLSNPTVISDRQLTASSYLDVNHVPSRGRIYTQKDGSLAGGWSPVVSDKNQYIQVDFVSHYTISGVVTQGLADEESWVQKYIVYYSTDGVNFDPVLDSSHKPFVFNGNSDKHTPVSNFFSPVVARYIQIRPLEFHNSIGLRFNVFGCEAPSATPVIVTEITPSSAPGCLYWSPWISENVPDQVSGEMENFYQEPLVTNACSKDFVIGIECRVKQTKVMWDPTDPYVECSLNDATFTCIPDTDHLCEDYEIRVLCNTCSLTTITHSTPTPSASTPTENYFVSTSTPSVGSHVSSPQPCVSGWSPWINKATPTGTRGDYEKMTKEEMAEFCPGGHMTEVQCRDASTGDDYLSLKEATCTVEDGLICDNMIAIGIDCHDYEIRYRCQCAGLYESTTHPFSEHKSSTHFILSGSPQRSTSSFTQNNYKSSTSKSSGSSPKSSSTGSIYESSTSRPSGSPQRFSSTGRIYDSSTSRPSGSPQQYSSTGSIYESTSRQSGSPQRSSSTGNIYESSTLTPSRSPQGSSSTGNIYESSTLPPSRSPQGSSSTGNIYESSTLTPSRSPQGSSSTGNIYESSTLTPSRSPQGSSSTGNIYESSTLPPSRSPQGSSSTGNIYESSTLTPSRSPQGSSSTGNIYESSTLPPSRSPQGSSSTGNIYESSTLPPSRSPQGSSSTGNIYESSTLTPSRSPQGSSSTGNIYESSTLTPSRSPQGSSSTGNIYEPSTLTPSRSPQRSSSTGNIFEPSTLTPSRSPQGSSSTGNIFEPSTLTPSRSPQGSSSTGNIFEPSTLTPSRSPQGSSSTGNIYEPSTLTPSRSPQRSSSTGNIFEPSTLTPSRSPQGSSSTGNIYEPSTLTPSRSPQGSSSTGNIFVPSTLTPSRSPQGSSSTGNIYEPSTLTPSRSPQGSSSTGNIYEPSTLTPSRSPQGSSSTGNIYESSTLTPSRSPQGSSSTGNIYESSTLPPSRSPQGSSSTGNIYESSTLTPSRSPQGSSSTGNIYEPSTLTPSRSPQRSSATGNIFEPSTLTPSRSPQGSSSTGNIFEPSTLTPSRSPQGSSSTGNIFEPSTLTPSRSPQGSSSTGNIFEPSTLTPSRSPQGSSSTGKNYEPSTLTPSRSPQRSSSTGNIYEPSTLTPSRSPQGFSSTGKNYEPSTLTPSRSPQRSSSTGNIFEPSTLTPSRSPQGSSSTGKIYEPSTLTPSRSPQGSSSTGNIFEPSTLTPSRSPQGSSSTFNIYEPSTLTPSRSPQRSSSTGNIYEPSTLTPSRSPQGSSSTGNIFEPSTLTPSRSPQGSSSTGNIFEHSTLTPSRSPQGSSSTGNIFEPSTLTPSRSPQGSSSTGNIFEPSTLTPSRSPQGSSSTGNIYEPSTLTPSRSPQGSSSTGNIYEPSTLTPSRSPQGSSSTGNIYEPSTLTPSRSPQGSSSTGNIFEPSTLTPSRSPQGSSSTGNIYEPSTLTSSRSPQRSSSTGKNYEPSTLTPSRSPQGSSSTGNIFEPSTLTPSRSPQGSSSTGNIYEPSTLTSSRSPQRSSSTGKNYEPSTLTPSRSPQGSSSTGNIFEPSTLTPSRSPQRSSSTGNIFEPSTLTPSRSPQGSSSTGNIYEPSTLTPSRIPQGSSSTGNIFEPSTLTPSRSPQRSSSTGNIYEPSTLTPSRSPQGSSSTGNIFEPSTLTPSRSPQGSSSTGNIFKPSTLTPSRSPQGSSSTGNIFEPSTLTPSRSPQRSSSTGNIYEPSTLTPSRSPQRSSSTGNIYEPSTLTPSRSPQGSSSTGNIFEPSTLTPSRSPQRSSSTGNIFEPSTLTPSRSPQGSSSTGKIYEPSTLTPSRSPQGSSSTGNIFEPSTLTPSRSPQGSSSTFNIYEPSTLTPSRSPQRSSSTGNIYEPSTLTPSRSPQGSSSTGNIFEPSTLTPSRSPQGSSSTGNIFEHSTLTPSRSPQGSSSTGNIFEPSTLTPSRSPQGSSSTGNIFEPSTLTPSRSPQGSSSTGNIYEPSTLTPSRSPQGSSSTGNIYEPSTLTPSRSPQGSSSTGNIYEPSTLTPSRSPQGSSSTGNIFEPSTLTPSRSPQGSSSTGNIYEPSTLTSSRSPQRSSSTGKNYEPSTLTPSRSPQGSSSTGNIFEPSTLTPSRSPQGSSSTGNIYEPSTLTSSRSPQRSSSTGKNYEPSTLTPSRSPQGSSSTGNIFEPSTLTPSRSPQRSSSTGNIFEPSTLTPSRSPQGSSSTGNIYEPSTLTPSRIPQGSSSTGNIFEPSTLTPSRSPQRSSSTGNIYEPSTLTPSRSPQGSSSTGNIFEPSTLTPSRSPQGSSSTGNIFKPSTLTPSRSPQGSSSTGNIFEPSTLTPSRSPQRSSSTGNIYEPSTLTPSRSPQRSSSTGNIYEPSTLTPSRSPQGSSSTGNIFEPSTLTPSRSPQGSSSTGNIYEPSTLTPSRSPQGSSSTGNIYEPSTLTPSRSPQGSSSKAPGCLYWSPWISKNVPDQVSGEMENFYQEPLVTNACSKDFVIGIECRVKQTKVMFDPTDPYVECSLNDATFTCIPDTDHICEDYEIRVQCNTCSLTTVPRSTPPPSASSPTENYFVSTSTSSVGSHVSSPQPCVSGWSPWINKATPTGTHGDYEKMTKEEMAEFCPGGHMTEVQCRDASTGDDYWSLQEATCTVEDGLICDSMVTIGIDCHDYEIRYRCQCAGVPTSAFTNKQSGSSTRSPSTGQYSSHQYSSSSGHHTSPTPYKPGSSLSPVHNCRSGWSEWINNNSPVGTVGDFEKMTKEELSHFCPGGDIIDISCVDSDQGDDWSSLAEAKCTVNDGLQCVNVQIPDVPPCRDYKIKYLCKCPDIPTPSKIQVNCGWSPWLNANKPDSGIGDIESISEIKRIFGVCSNIIDIECRVADTKALFSQSGQDRLACDFLNGFRCYNSEQVDGQCLDYEVQVLCWDNQCSGPIPTIPSITTKVPHLTTLSNDETRTTPGSCPPGEEWQKCAFKCDEVCDYMGRSSGSCNGILNPRDNCVPGCRSLPEMNHMICKDSERFINSRTCVSKALCTCLKPDGTPAKAFDTWENPEYECSTCSCFNGEAVCGSIDGCSTKPLPPGVTRPVEPPVCGWSLWMNENTPSISSGGDMELLSTLQKLHHICAYPMRIICRDVSTKKEAADSGQVVTCDLVNGLKCFDYQNAGRCHDYEIAVYCGCPDTTTQMPRTESNKSPTPSVTSSSPSSSKPDSSTQSQVRVCSSGWSEWINRNSPRNSTGDSERMTKEEKAAFCPGGKITEIECVDSDQGDDWSSLSEATCTVDDGLDCANIPIDEIPPCRDYKIRYKCNCSDATVPPPSHSSSTPSSNISQSGCGWTAWMNGQHPNGMGEEESITQLRSLHTICDTTDILAVECRDSASGKTAQELGQVNVLCDLSYSGLKCFDFDQPDGHCADYEVRFMCEPSTCHVTVSQTFATSPSPQNTPSVAKDTTTQMPRTESSKRPTPSVTSSSPSSSKPDSSTQSQVRVCSSGWSDWINRNSPRSSTGDSERMTKAEQVAFCPGGKITDIECVDSDQGDDWSSLSEATCTVDDGLDCANIPIDGIPQCRDYKIRYKCNCSDTTTQMPRTESSKRPTPSVTSSSPSSSKPDSSTQSQVRVCSSGWSDWINRNSPRSSTGDSERMTKDEKVAFCPGGKITDIECVDSDQGDDWSSLSEATCTVDDGLDCANIPIDGIPQCRDYKIRYKCNCSDTTTQMPRTESSKRPTPSVTSSSPSSSKPDSSTQSQVRVCSSGWSDWINRNSPRSSTGDSERMTKDEKVAFCPGGKITDIECVDSDQGDDWSSLSEATCTVDDGLDCANIPIDGIPQCRDYKIRYKCICSDTTTQMPRTESSKRPTPSVTSSSPSSSKPDSSTQSQVRVCSSGWSDWINRNSPRSSTGDSERMTKDEKVAFCPGGKITDIECVDSDQGDDWSSLSEATCTVDDGLDCANIPIDGIPQCRDYKIRYKCICSAGMSSTLRTPQPTTASSGKPPRFTTAPTTLAAHVCISGWSTWINRNSPTSPSATGDYEKMTQQEISSFCPSGHLTDIECVDSDQGDDWSSLAEATCSVAEGLSCDNLPVPDIPPCRDYKIRYMCNCSDNIQQSIVKRSVSIPLLGLQPAPIINIPDECTEEMGVRTGYIHDSMITASSSRDDNHLPQRARLGSAGNWLAGTDDNNQYIQVNFVTPVYLSGVITQGQYNAPLFVTSYKILHSLDGVNWNPYREKRVDKIFPANTDSFTPVSNKFSKLIRTRYLRINPQTWKGKIAMRIEVQGCFKEYQDGALRKQDIELPMLNIHVHKQTPVLNQDIVYDCIIWDHWVDTYQPSIRETSDIEPLDDIINASPSCKDPIAIECRTATPDQTFAKSSGQNVACNLWDGLLCNSSQIKEPLCFNYEARLGCLKDAPECESQMLTPAHTSSPYSKALKVCYPEVDAAACPRCTDGYYCDGVKCVLKSDCPCMVDSKVVRSGGVILTSSCETCQCLGGQAVCMPKMCPACSFGIAELDETACTCQCKKCSIGEFQCTDGSCIPDSRRCDGIIDCTSDEDDCEIAPRNAAVDEDAESCTARLLFTDPTESIGYFHIAISNGHICQNVNPLPHLKECSGFCRPRTSYAKVIQNTCHSCQATQTSSHSIRLSCTDGSYRDKNYQVPEVCACAACPDRI